MRRALLLTGGIVLSLSLPSTAGAVLVYSTGEQRPAVWVAADDGSGARQLAQGDSPQVSPDGRTVAFRAPAGTAGSPSLHLIPTGGGPSRALLSPWEGGALEWSPDGRLIATLTGAGSEPHRLVLVDVASGAARRIADGSFSSLSFSPTGDRLVYGRSAGEAPTVGSDLYVAPTSGGAPKRLTTGGRSLNPVWGAEEIAYSRQGRGRNRASSTLWALDPDGGDSRRLVRRGLPSRGGAVLPIAWSADGRRLLAQFDGQRSTYLVAVDAGSGRARRIGPRGRGGGSSGQVVGFDLSRDGSTALAQASRPGGRGSVVAMPLGGGSSRVLARNGDSPDWNR